MQINSDLNDPHQLPSSFEFLLICSHWIFIFQALRNWLNWSCPSLAWRWIHHSFPPPSNNHNFTWHQAPQAPGINELAMHLWIHHASLNWPCILNLHSIEMHPRSVHGLNIDLLRSMLDPLVQLQRPCIRYHMHQFANEDRSCQKSSSISQSFLPSLEIETHIVSLNLTFDLCSRENLTWTKMPTRFSWKPRFFFFCGAVLPLLFFSLTRFT